MSGDALTPALAGLMNAESIIAGNGGDSHSAEAAIRACLELWVDGTISAAVRLAALPPVEREIIDIMSERLEAGRSEYGCWPRSDDRDLSREALEEVIDALHYVAAELIRAKGL